VSKGFLDSVITLCQRLLDCHEEETKNILDFVNQDTLFKELNSSHSDKEERDTINLLLEQLKTLWRFKMRNVQLQQQTDETVFKLIYLCQYWKQKI
jgi:hypothetical protein